MPPGVIDKILSLRRERYSDYGPTLLAEKLASNHDIHVDHETIRRILLKNGEWKTRRRKGVRHVWRERKHYFGDLVQIDGSLHDWFEDGTLHTLIAFIDDATGRVELLFAQQETIKSLVDCTRMYLKKHGRPMALYADCGKVFRVNNYKKEEERPKTQYERMLRELDIEMIHAYSPQAKGRVERVFQTLQDRLVKELRELGIKSIEMANKFLQDEFTHFFNDKFAQPPANALDLHRSIDGYDLNSIFCIKDRRILNNDRTVVYKEQWLQLDKKQPVQLSAGVSVTVSKNFDGTLHLSFKGQKLNFVPIKKEQRRRKVPKKQAPKRDSYHKPSKNHPWRAKW